MEKNLKRMLALWLALLLCLCCVPSALASSDHIVIHQVYGASHDGYASHSFIELYNPGREDVDLSGWSVQYQSSESGSHHGQWYVCSLSGTIRANGYFLIRCGAVSETKNVRHDIPEGNLEWDIQLYNKGLSVALLSNPIKLDAAFAGDVTQTDAVGLVDLAAVQGNDGLADQIPPAYESSYDAVQSKKKAIRRSRFVDTNQNLRDFITVDYSKSVPKADLPHKGD